MSTTFIKAVRAEIAAKAAPAMPSPPSASAERDLPLDWRTADISWICYHLKETTVFDADALQRLWNEMKEVALSAAPVAPGQAPQPVLMIAVPKNEFYNSGNGWLEVSQETWNRTAPEMRRTLYTAPIPAPAQQPEPANGLVLPPAAAPAGQRDSDIDTEAIAWAYQKLLNYGVGNTNMDQALMLDRLNLILLGGDA